MSRTWTATAMFLRPSSGAVRSSVRSAHRLRCTPLIPLIQIRTQEEGSGHHSSDTESIGSAGGTSDVEGEVEVVSVLEPPVPAWFSLLVGSTAVFSGWQE